MFEHPPPPLIQRCYPFLVPIAIAQMVWRRCDTVLNDKGQIFTGIRTD